jgi:hypothetical protein
MLPVNVEEHRIVVGKEFSIAFLRTLRIPDDGQVYPLPPELGEFRIHPVEDFASQVPAQWLTEGGVFLTLFQREALWIGFDGTAWKPNAVKIGVGDVNAVSGEAWREELGSPQDYLVCPPQPWLDGINAGDGFVRQFVATPLGSDESVEAQLTGRDIGGMRLLVYEPRPGKFPDHPPRRGLLGAQAAESTTSGALSVAAGGMIRQRIYPDRWGVNTWDPTNVASIRVHLLNSAQYSAITGLEPPASPIDASAYARFGFPWFDLYDEGLGDVPARERLARVRTARDRGQERRQPLEAPDASVPVDKLNVRTLSTPVPPRPARPSPPDDNH